MATVTRSRFTVRWSFTFAAYAVVDNLTGEYITNKKGQTRTFRSTNGARKAITRQRTRDFHR